MSTDQIKLAYLVLEHKYPEQLLRLINRLNSENSTFFIHIDRGSNFSDFRDVFNEFPSSKIRLIQRERSRWGSLGLVKAALNGFNEVVRTAEKFDYIVLLSGQDYPIKNNSYINNFFQRNYGKNFIEFFSLPTDQWFHGGMDRINHMGVCT